jgi:perosamine synthetase
MSDWILPLYKIYSDDEDVNLVTKIIRRGTYWAIGPEIEEFENDLKNYLGVDYCIAMNSGTSALHATLLSYNIKANDEVIVPSFSFISTANSVLFVNAKPIFADIEKQNYGLDPLDIRKKISTKTKMIMPMDFGGLSCKINEIKQIVDEKNLILVEDGAESLGSSANNKKTGTSSDATIFSFCGNKVITTGEGGAVATNSKEVYDKINLIRSHGRQDNSNYFNNPEVSQYVDVGFNWRMSSITAALGISQLQKLDKLIKMRQEHANYITNRISKHKEIKPPFSNDEYENIFQMYTITLNNKTTRDNLHKFLLEKKIFCKIYFSPIHLTKFYQNKIGNNYSLPNTEDISNLVLTLPLFPNMTQEEKEYLINSIDEFFEK